MKRDSMIVRRMDGTALDGHPLRELAFAYCESTVGMESIHIERSSTYEVEISFVWEGVGRLPPPEEKLYRFGLLLGRVPSGSAPHNLPT